MSNEVMIRKMNLALKATQERIAQLHAMVTADAGQVRSTRQDIDSIPGRRTSFVLSGTTTFTSAQDNAAGTPVVMNVTQDGPFVLTHYPVISWKPSLPTGATNFGRYSAIRSWPLPVQQVTSNIDIIDISYTLFDAGVERNLQNLVISSQVISTGDNIIPLPVPTLFKANSTINLTPFYNNILFNGGAGTPTTTGTLQVDLPGYRIVNA